MKKAPFSLLLFVLLAFGVCFAIPAQDLPETAYDESEAELCEAAPWSYEVMPMPASSASKPASAAPLSGMLNTCKIRVERIDSADPPPFTPARVTLSLMSLLMC